jgi:hypothetical protein
MKFKEPVNGYKLASGETLLHMTFFITMFFLDFGPCIEVGDGETTSELYNFQTLCYFMWFVHLYRIIKVALELSFHNSFRAQVLIGTIIEIGSILIYIGGTFYNQNMYFDYHEETDPSL